MYNKMISPHLNCIASLLSEYWYSNVDV